jgi:hypothetical protein
MHLLQALAENSAPDPAKALLTHLGVDTAQLIFAFGRA